MAAVAPGGDGVSMVTAKTRVADLAFRFKLQLIAGVFGALLGAMLRGYLPLAEYIAERYGWKTALTWAPHWRPSEWWDYAQYVWSAHGDSVLIWAGLGAFLFVSLARGFLYWLDTGNMKGAKNV